MAAVLLCTAAALFGETAGAARPGLAIALTGVNVVDVRGGNIRENQTVVINGTKIIAVHNASTPISAGVHTVPSVGKYVMPGLWDMHVHVTDEAYLDMFIANGITGVRDMGGGIAIPSNGCESVNPTILRKWRSEAAAGKRLAPELVISGPAVSGSGWPTSLQARSADEAKSAVKALQRLQVDFVKVYERIPLDAYQVLAREAKRHRMLFAGHVPEAVGPLVAIRSGQRSIEHIRDALLVCFTSDAGELDRFFTADGWSEKDKAWGRTANSACPGIIQAMRDNEAWLTPTLTVEKAKVRVEDATHREDKRRGGLPQSVRDGYQAYAKGKLAQSPAERASERLWWRTQQKLVGRMNREGVRFLAGTDAACEGGLPGDSLHGELKELVAAGLSPLDSLRAATLQPASYFKRKAEGEVLPGYRANLLLLDANPLTSIENTRRIHAVVLDGKLLDRTRLDRLLRKHRLLGQGPLSTHDGRSPAVRRSVQNGHYRPKGSATFYHAEKGHVPMGR